MADTLTIDRAEYEALLADREMLADMQAYDRAMARIAAGEDELVPAAFADRIIDGESPIRVYREFRGLTVSALADASGVNRVQIHQIEGGQKTGSIETLKRISVALHVTVDDLI